MSQLSANSIIDLALARIGNATIQLQAQSELQLILNRLYEDYRWPFGRVTTTGSVSGSTISLPADFMDFWDRFSLTLYDSDDNPIPTVLIPTQKYELQATAASISGTPFRAWVDLENSLIQLDSTSDDSLTYRLIYRKFPTQISDFDAVVDFPNDSILVQLLFCWALQFEDDDRYAAELQVADNMIGRYRRRFGVSPNVSSKAAFNPSVFGNLQTFK